MSETTTLSDDPILEDGLELVTDLLARARAAGADAADAVWFESASLAVSWRLGKLEDVERSESTDLGLRVFIGRRQAIASTTDLGPSALEELVTRVIAMARAAPEDPYAGLAPRDLLFSGPLPALDLFDPHEPSPDALIERARAAEDAARAVPGITNSEGATANWGRQRVALAASNGFAHGYATTRAGLSAQVIAGEGTEMEADYDYCSVRHLGDLDDPAELGRRAGERAVARLGPRRVATATMPVVFAPRVANSLLGHFAGAVNGRAVARGTSFLGSRMNEAVFAGGVTIIDDPLRVRGLRSRPFDGEGVRTRRIELVRDGRLESWLLDVASAAQLELASLGHAGRGTSSPPSPTTSNLYMAPGTVSPDELIADIKDGIYVTALIGMGVNPVTGDYSRGASGFKIENGEITHPVSELTIAGNLNDMFANLTPANDLEFRYGTNAPTLRIDAMTVAGQ